jgi:hypothetical protein
MKRIPFLKSLCVALFLTAFFSCQNQFDVLLEANLPARKVSIAEAKAWIVKAIPAHPLQAQGQILWDLAEETTFNNAPLLTVPMLPADNSEQLLMKKDGQFTKSLVSTQRLLFYTDASGNTKASLIKTENSQNGNLKNYTGSLHFFDPKTNTPQATWQLKNGNFVGSVSFETTSKNMRTSSCDWELYQMVCGDECTGQIGGADNGDYLPEAGQGCCWKLKECGSGSPTDPSNPSTPDPFIPIFNPNSPIIPGILGGGGVNGGGIISGIFPWINLGFNTGNSSLDAFLVESQRNVITYSANEIAFMKTYSPFVVNNIRANYGTWNKPDGSKAFKLSEENQQKYPKFTEIVKNISFFVEQNPKVKNTLIRATGFKWGEIKEMFKFGKGLQIDIFNLRAFSNSKLVVAHFSAGPYEPKIEFDEQIPAGLEVV